MSSLTALKVVELVKETNTSPTLIRRKKLAKKIDEQIRVATDATYQPTIIKWVKTDEGDKKVEQPKRLKRWWHTNSEGKTILTIRYGTKPLELQKGKCAVELDTEDAVADTLELVKTAVLNGELDVQIEAQTAFGRKVKK
jgi:uncharacterized protein with ParB-like and HNH nuclease domain